MGTLGHIQDLRFSTKTDENRRKSTGFLIGDPGGAVIGDSGRVLIKDPRRALIRDPGRFPGEWIWDGSGRDLGGFGDWIWGESGVDLGGSGIRL